MNIKKALFILRHGSYEGRHKYLEAVQTIEDELNRQNSNIEELKSKNSSLTSDLTSLRAEIKRLEYTLLGVMHRVDKWLDGDELKQNEVDRAATMREKTLQIVEEKEAKIERLEANNKVLSNVIKNTFLAKAGCEISSFVEIRAEAAKEFAERLKLQAYTECSITGYKYQVVQIEEIDNLVKEFTGGEHQ